MVLTTAPLSQCRRTILSTAALEPRRPSCRHESFRKLCIELAQVCGGPRRS